MDMGESTATTYFEARYSYRRKSIFIYVGFFTAAGLFAMVKSSDFFRNVSIGGIVISAVCLGLSGWLLLQFARARELASRIDSSGITCDRKHWPWNEIAWVWGSSNEAGIQLFFQRRAFLSVDRQLWADQGLTEEAYEGLIERLVEEVQSRFPHVQLGT